MEEESSEGNDKQTVLSSVTQYSCLIKRHNKSHLHT